MAGITGLDKKYVLAPFGYSGTQVKNNDITLNSPSAPNAMTWQDGIPTITTQPIKDDGTGGIPSRAGDFGGVLNVLSNEIYNSKLGISPQEWDSNVGINELGGYPQGAVVVYPIGSASNKRFYVSLEDNNKDIPTNSNWVQIVASTDLSNITTTPIVLGVANNTPDVVVSSYMGVDNSWYRKYKSGWVEQGGMLLNCTGNNGTRNIILPIPISNLANANITSTDANVDGDWDYSTFGIKWINTTTLQAKWGRNPSGWNLYWQAKGLAL